MDKRFIDNISKSKLFQDINIKDIEHLIKCLKCKIVEYKKDEYIAIEGNKFTGAGVILAGNVSIIKENINGDRINIVTLKESDIFGEVIAFSGEDKWPFSILAQSNCTIMFIQPEKIINICSETCIFHKTLIKNSIVLVSKKAITLNKRIEYLTLKTIKAKISKYLLDQYKDQNSLIINLKFNREELSDFLNVARPSLSRELCKMRDEGIIKFNKKTITIIDLNILSDY